MIIPFLQKQWSLDIENPPWGSVPSIYDHVLMHIDPSQPVGLIDGGDSLPDEAPKNPNEMRFAAGAIDGIMRHAQQGMDSEQVQEIYAALKNALRHASAKNARKYYELIKTANTLEVIDDVITLIMQDGEIDSDRLREISRWFVTKGVDREAVKFSTAMLGLTRGYDDLDVFLVIGRHEEFTPFSAVAIVANEAYGEKALLRLAKSVFGWGRINTVERFAETDDPEIKDWLIREGFKNDVMGEYLACMCARAGELDKALAVNAIDDNLFQSACEIIDTLVSGMSGAGELIENYEQGCGAVTSLLRHGTDRFQTTFHFSLLAGLQKRAEEHLSGKRTLGQNWSDEAVKRVTSDINGILSWDSWKETLIEALRNGDWSDFARASEYCARVGIDPWPYYVQRIEAGEDKWWHLMSSADDARIDEALRLAEKHISLAEITTGPSDVLGLGEDYLLHSRIDFVVQELRRFPGKGWVFIAAALRSPVVRNRNMAIKALSSWPKDAWPAEAETLIGRCIFEEPREDVKARLVALLKGEDIP